jgi:hypothetical protein
LLELNAQSQAKAAACEEERLAQNKEEYFMICPTFLRSVYYLPHDHHMSVRHKMANNRSAKKSVANYKIRQWQATLRGQHCRHAPVSHAAMLHHLMRDASEEMRLCLVATKGKNNNESACHAP